MEDADQWDCMERQKLLFPRRRPAREGAEDLGGKRGSNDIPTAQEELPGCSEEESGRCLRRVDRRKRPKLTNAEITTLLNCDRPLERGERIEMSAERQWGALDLMGLMKKDDPTTVVGEGSASKVTTSPKPPPPKAPLAAYAMDPSRRSQNSLGEEGRKGYFKGKDSEWEEAKGGGKSRAGRRGD